MAALPDVLPGDTVTVTVVIKTTSSGAFVDPGGLSLVAKSPNGTLTTYTYPGDIGRTVAGVYNCPVVIPRTNTSAAVGLWHAEWVGTGANRGIGQTNWNVKASVVL